MEVDEVDQVSAAQGLVDFSEGRYSTYTYTTDIDEKIKTVFDTPYYRFSIEPSDWIKKAIRFVYTILEILLNSVDQLKDNSHSHTLTLERNILLPKLKSHLEQITTYYNYGNIDLIEQCFDVYITTLRMASGGSFPADVMMDWVRTTQTNVIVKENIDTLSQNSNTELGIDDDEHKIQDSAFIDSSDMNLYTSQVLALLDHVLTGNLTDTTLHARFNVNLRKAILSLSGIHIFSLDTLNSMLFLPDGSRKNNVLQFLLYAMADRDILETRMDMAINLNPNFDQPMLVNSQSTRVLVRVDATGKNIDLLSHVLGDMGRRGKGYSYTSRVDEVDGAGNRFKMTERLKPINDKRNKVFKFTESGGEYLQYSFFNRSFGSTHYTAVGLKYFGETVPNSDQHHLVSKLRRESGNSSLIYTGNQITITSVNAAAQALLAQVRDHRHTGIVQFAKKILDDAKVQELATVEQDFITTEQGIVLLRLFSSIDVTPLIQAAKCKNLLAITRGGDGDFICFLPFHILKTFVTKLKEFPTVLNRGLLAPPTQFPFGKRNLTKKVDNDIKYLNSL